MSHILIEDMLINVQALHYQSFQESKIQLSVKDETVFKITVAILSLFE